MQFVWDCPRATWARVVAHAQGATVFHQPAWADAVAAAGLGRPDVLLARWPDGREAILTVAVRPLWRGLVRAARCGSNGGYGGILATGPLTPAEQAAMYREMRRRYPENSGNTNPFLTPVPDGCGLDLKAADDVRLLDLAPLEALQRGYNEERRRAVRRYQKSGVEVRFVDQPDAADLEQFWRLYQIEVGTWARQGRSLRWAEGRRWFEQLWRHLPDQLHMAVAMVAGEAAGTVLYTGHGPYAHYLYLAWDRRFEAQRVATALVEASLQDCHARGHRVFDFMTSLGFAGVDRFKASFGAERAPLWEYVHHRPTSRLIMGAQRLWPGRRAAAAPAAP